MTSPTSFRLPKELVDRTAEEAARLGMSTTALVTSLLDEGLKTREFPGIVFRDGPAGRRAAVIGGPDVWEIIRALRLVEGRGDQRIRQVSEDTGVPVSVIHVAVDYASANPDEVEARITLNERAVEQLRIRAHERDRLLSR